MQQILIKLIRNSAFFLCFLFTFSFTLFAQNTCFTKEDTKKIIESISQNKAATENKEVRKELLKMVEARNKLNQKITDNYNKNKDLIVEFNKLGETHILRLCQIIKEKGWLTKEQLKEDGYQAMMFIIVNNRAFRLQTEFYPILVEASKKGFISKPDLASTVDSIRVGIGQPQIFGTQAKIRDDIIYIQPLLNEEKLNEWRKDYDLPAMNSFIKLLERQYGMPVLKMPLPARLENAGKPINADTSALGINNEDEILKIDTKLVNLNVRIFNQSLKTPESLQLTKEDFAVFENGQEQPVSFFSATETPFDLVLLLDFSGSTVEKRGLIKQAAQRFVEAARPTDRIAVIVFTNQIEVLSNLTTERADLIKKIKEIELDGGSRIWGTVKYAYENIIRKESAGKRSAIVLMSDGIDGSVELTFADLFEMVRKNDSTFFSVYLETGGGYRNDDELKSIRKGQKSMYLLAEESGGTAYYAKNAKDLSGIYEQIVRELGTVYSVGYEPQNDRQDGTWRNLEVKIKTHPELTAKTRKGYYAK